MSTNIIPGTCQLICLRTVQRCVSLLGDVDVPPRTAPKLGQEEPSTNEEGYWDCHAKERPICKQADDGGNNNSHDQRRQEKDEVIIGSRVELSFKIISDSDSKKISTPWIMHEYGLLDNKFDDDEQLVVCKIYQKTRKDLARIRPVFKRYIYKAP